MSENRPEAVIEGASIVALGAFNPAIFQPLWFSNSALLRKEEAEQAKIELVHPQATIFATDWFSLQVTQERFVVETSDPTKVFPLRDLVSGTFKILEHTPIRIFGLNRYTHFRMLSEESWHSFGHGLVPKDAWNELLVQPGLRFLTISGKRRESDSEEVLLKVEPSAKVLPHGIFFHANQQYKLAGNDETVTRITLPGFSRRFKIPGVTF